VPPTAGRRVITIDGEGKVISVSNNKKTATVLLDDSKTVVIPWEEVVEKEDE
jgi:hypothetical protein